MSETSTSNVWVFLEAIARRRGLIVGLVLLAIVGAVVVSLLLPKWYTANALLLPPQDSVAEGGLNAITQISSPTGETRFPGMITPNDVYARMLRSRRVANNVIEKLDMKTHFKVANNSDLYEVLDGLTEFRVTDEGLLSVSAEWQTPQGAADLANTYVDELTDLSQDLLSQAARSRREFVEGRLNEVSGQLDSARQALETFQVTYRAVDFDEQTSQAIQQATDLKVKLANIDLDMQMKKRLYGEDNPELIDLQQRRDILQNQLDELEWGGSDSSFFALPVASVPELRGRYESLYSKVQVNETLHRTLMELYEEARIQESENTPVIAVLDRAVPPEKRSRPQRSVIVLGTAVMALLVSILLALWLEYVRRLKEQHPEDYSRLMLFVRAYLGWLPGVSKASTK